MIEMMRAKGIEVEEFVFTNATKAKIVTDLAVAFEQKKILLPKQGRTLEESRAIQDLEVELFNFEPTVLKSGNIRYEAAGAYHDDMIMALCLAHEQSERATRQPWSSYLIVGEPKTALDQNAPRPSPYRVTNDLWATLGLNDCGPERWWHHI